MNKIVIASFPAIIFLASCGGQTKPNDKDSLTSHKEKTTQQGEKPVAEQPKVVRADEKSLWQEHAQKATVLIGDYFESTYDAVPDKLREIIPPLMRSAATAKATITGSFMIVFSELPVPFNGGKDKKIKYFIGIPVKRKVQAVGVSFMEIQPGDFLKIQLNCEPGKGLQEHLRLLKEMKEQNISVSAPVIETYSESRNANMTSVLNKATFYYKKP